MGVRVSTEDIDTDVLLMRVSEGDSVARSKLLERHRARLRQMISLRLDRRLWSRADPSDVVQETFAEAAGRLPEYVATRPVPFSTWLRRLAWEHLVRLHEIHIRAQKRSVLREARSLNALTEESMRQLAGKLAVGNLSPDRRLVNAERRSRLLAALSALSEVDREILVMRYLEQMSIAEIATTLSCTEGAVRTRHSRALARLTKLLQDSD
jgi:RNA polymerase sigma-70 factor (ECF subfamily)